ncbi:hypothetical protein AC249_AIPGENE11260, partial [Exaiptasia diaphana]
KGRATSTCVQRHQVREAWDKFEKSGEAKRSFSDEEVIKIIEEIEDWELFHDSQTKEKKPSDLRVCYLAGENPLNDLNIFKDNGVLSQNIWAIEKDPKTHKKAEMALEESHKTIRVQFLKGDLIEILKEDQEDKFDIIYFDATGPLPSKKQKTLKAIGYVFLYNKLASPGALITTFSFPPVVTENEDKEKEKKVKEEKENLTELAKGYLKYRLKNTTEHPSDLEEFLDSRSDEENYSDYITYQVIDTAYMYMPAITILSSNSRYRKSLWTKMFVERDTFISKVETTDTVEYGLSQNFLVELWKHMNVCKKDNPYCKTWVIELFRDGEKKKQLRFILAHLLPNSNTLLSRYSNEKFKTLLRKVFTNCYQVQNEGDQESEDDFNHYLAKMVTSFLYGKSAYPSFIVPNKFLRLKYFSSEDTISDLSHRRQMFADVFIFDKCRYAFDQYNSVGIGKTIEDKIDNWIIKTIIKCLRKKLSFICNDVFEWCKSMEIPKRENISLLHLKKEGYTLMTDSRFEEALLKFNEYLTIDKDNEEIKKCVDYCQRYDAVTTQDM